MNARAQHEEDVPGEDSFVLENQEDLDDETQLLAGQGRSKLGRKETRSLGALVRPSRSGRQRAPANSSHE